MWIYRGNVLSLLSIAVMLGDEDMTLGHASWA